ncbi:MAG: autotransporter outer membrane beta-barrel domain-containing protein [Bdellovibrionales bacterium]
MNQIRAALILAFGFALLLTGAQKAWADTVTNRSTLPTTAYSMVGVSQSLASVEERNIMGRLKVLRHTPDLLPDRTAVKPVIYPLQKSRESFHDLRETANPASTKPAGKFGTTNYYRMYNRAMYRSPDDTLPPSDPTWADKAYDKVMGLVTIGAGAPNENHRESDEPRVRIVPNMADRAATNVLNATGDLAGQNQVWATATGGMPRRIIADTYKGTPAPSHYYRGQPLAMAEAETQSAPIPLATAQNAPIPLTATTPQITVTQPANDPYHPAKPVIYGPNDPIPAQEPLIKTIEDIPSPPSSQDIPFTYQKIDQSKGLTTPILGNPSAKTSLTIRQPNAYALLSSDKTNVGRYASPRRASDVGTYLWVEEESTPSRAAVSPEPAPTTVVPESLSYGTQAVPLKSTGRLNADRRWGFFLTGSTGFGEDELQVGSDTKNATAGFTAGADYRIAEQSFVGMALTYLHSSFTTGDYGDLQSDSMAVSLYGTTTFAQKAYMDGYVSLGYLSMDSERTIFASGTTPRASADPDGFQFAAKAETGYSMKDADWTYGPYAGFRLAYADFDDLSEEDAGSYNLRVQGFNTLSAIGSLGIDGGRRFVMSNGGVLLPSLRLGYNHEFGDDTASIKAEYINLANSRFTTKTDKKSRDWINLSPSLTASLPNDWTLVAQYEHDFFRDDVNENIFNITAHYAW